MKSFSSLPALDLLVEAGLQQAVQHLLDQRPGLIAQGHQVPPLEFGLEMLEVGENRGRWPSGKPRGAIWPSCRGGIPSPGAPGDGRSGCGWAPPAEEPDQGLLAASLPLTMAVASLGDRLKPPQHLRQFRQGQMVHQPQEIDQPALVVIFQVKQVVPGEHRLDPFQHGGGWPRR